jgi:uncharacterized protein YndB with AHSA1/START domain
MPCRVQPGVQYVTNQGETTLVNVSIKHDTLEDLEKIIEMGFKEGFTMAMGNLDELFSTYNNHHD